VVNVEAGSDLRIRLPTIDTITPKTKMAAGKAGHLSGRTISFSKSVPAGVSVTGVTRDDAPFPEIYDPSHPDANEEGFVQMPNVDLLGEMVDLMLASRVYEANLAVLEASRENAKQALDLMR
jgi:flagellar basal-body rod protein FlgC